MYKPMIYASPKPAWHSLGEQASGQVTAIELLDDKFKLDGEDAGGFGVYVRPLLRELNGDLGESHYFNIVRGRASFDPKEIEIGTCTSRFQPLQPYDIANSFDTHVNTPVETLGFVTEGKEMFISWKMPELEVVVGDTLSMFGIVRCGFDTLKGARLFTSIWRPVCLNTLNMAEGWASKNTDGNGKGMIWHGRANNRNLLQELGYWMKHVQDKAVHEAELISGLFGKFAKTPIESDAQARGIIQVAYPDLPYTPEYFPKELRADKDEKIKAVNESTSEVRNGIFGLFSGDGTGITPDYWGLLNATTEYFCRVQPSKKPVASSIMFGGRQKDMMQMVEVLSDLTR